MNLPKDLALCVRFARFCAEYAVEPADLAELIVLARRVFSAAERACSEDTEAARTADGRASERFADKAAALGFVADFPGLWPCLRRDGNFIEIPS